MYFTGGEDGHQARTCDLRKNTDMALNFKTFSFYIFPLSIAYSRNEPPRSQITERREPLSLRSSVLLAERSFSKFFCLFWKPSVMTENFLPSNRMIHSFHVTKRHNGMKQHNRPIGNKHVQFAYICDEKKYFQKAFWFFLPTVYCGIKGRL